MEKIVLRMTRMLLTLLTLSAANAHATSLSEVIHHTLHTHPQLKASVADVEASHYELRRASGGYLPHVDIFGSTARQYSDTPVLRAGGMTGRRLNRHESRASLRQLVFDGFEVSSEVNEKRHLLQRSKYQLFDNENEIIFETISAYLNVLRTREVVTFAKQNVKIHQQTLSKAQNRFQAGAGRRVDVQLAISRLSLATARLDTAHGQEYIANAAASINDQ